MMDSRNLSIMPARPVAGSPMTDSDGELDEDQLAAAMKDVDDEMEIFPPNGDYLDHLPYEVNHRIFSTKLIENEHALLDEGLKEPNSSRNVQSKIHSPPTASSNLTPDEAVDCRKSLDKLKVMIEYQHRQIVNLELMKMYEAPTRIAWQQYTQTLESEIKKYTEELLLESKQIEPIPDSDMVNKTLAELTREWTASAEKRS